MSAHTAGPWHAMHADDGSLVAVMARLKGHGHGAAEAIGYFEDDHVSKREVLANATLAAAAPDLLSACRAIIVEWSHFAPTTAAATITLVEAAIAKAEGK
jgi:hypothetical protein